MKKVRIQKVLSAAGLASRRAAEQMVLDGRVTVNGELVTDLPCLVDVENDDIFTDGRPVRKRPAQRVYFLLNKPRGVVCTQHDPEGRPKAVDLVPGVKNRRVYCVGRLDADSTGLIILTNDGELTQYLTHPRYGVVKTYVAQVDGQPGEKEIARLKSGVHLDGRRTQPAGVKVLRRGAKQSLLGIRLAEGRNREIRRILARLGHKVRRLKRTAIGPITDRGLKVGNFRMLRPAEVARLRRSGRESKTV
ncbi:MAG: pseudouridine synthase [Planctomycetota bacterium]|nr:pseudouridine synthase [Planctomycetota bacterium]